VGNRPGAVPPIRAAASGRPHSPRRSSS